MHVFDKLPKGYRELLSINLQKDKKLALLVNGTAIAIGVLLVLIMHLFVPIGTLLDASDGDLYTKRFLMIAIGCVVYILLHEMVHGMVMKLYGAQQVKYGYTGLYAHAGTDEFFDKKSYLVIALAPVVFWGIVLLAAQFFVSGVWNWVVWAIQIANLSGAAGDAYVTWKFSKLPDDIIVQDSGVSMTVYTSQL